jgi:hypothetical protein
MGYEKGVRSQTRGTLRNDKRECSSYQNTIFDKYLLITQKLVRVTRQIRND